MKRILNILLVVFCLSNVWAIDIVERPSIFSQYDFVKVAVDETGICKITSQELRELGLNPAKTSVWGYGGHMLPQNFFINNSISAHYSDISQVPCYRSGNGTNESDYILFFARGPISWQFRGNRFVHTTHAYANQGFYFLTDDCESFYTLEANHTLSNLNNLALEVTTFQDCQVHELDSINLIDPTGYSGGGREWYGERMNTNRNTLSFSFSFANIIADSEMKVYVDVASTSQNITKLNVSLGETERTLMVVNKSSDHIEKAKVSSLNASFAPHSGHNQVVKLHYIPVAASDELYLNYVEITATCALKMVGGMLHVRNRENTDWSIPTRYVIEGTNEQTQVWDVTFPFQVQSVPVLYDSESGILKFEENNEDGIVHEYVVVNPRECSTIKLAPIRNVNGRPMSIKVPRQNLHVLKNVDMVIITPQSFITAAKELAHVHEMYDNLNVAVVTDEQVYNEFSSGTPDATAYRLLMKMLYDRARFNTNTNEECVFPSYLLLLGDGSFDNRKLLTTSGYNTLLTYQASNSVKETSAYATDDYFTWLEDNEGTSDIMATMDLSVGRLPVNTLQEAQEVVKKLIQYITNPSSGNWKSELCFLADDGDANMHTRGADRAAESVRNANPSFVVEKIYLDSYQQESTASGEKYPIAKNKFDNLLKNGVLLFDYCGHAGYNNICSENLLTAKEIREMTNENLGLWVLATCNFANFDSQKTSAAELAVLNPHGGALGVYASCRTVYAAQNEILNKNICDSLFAHRSACDYVHRIGDAIRLGKNATLRDENNLPYLLLGDPAIKLHLPTDYQVITTALSDTLRALTINTIQGCIQTSMGELVSDFNGKVQITVYDKLQTLSTLDNDQPKEEKKTIVHFLDYPNVLFKGDAEVIAGKFSSEFMVPKDIKYNFGNARIVFYAQDEYTGEEAIGHYEDFVVGGSSAIEHVDTIGPSLHLYINNPVFANGDKTNEYPHFYATIEDENGINTVGSGIGHDLLLTIDNSFAQSYVLNNYFKAESNSYQRGNVSFRLSEMSEGMHSLTFRAWDLLNNSSTATLDFEVVKGFAPQIFSVMTYPNPVRTDGMITIEVQHDRPDDVLQVNYIVYDFSGQIVWSTTSSSADVITFTASEAHLNPGVYIYKVNIKTIQQQEFTSKMGKLIVN